MRQTVLPLLSLALGLGLGAVLSGGEEPGGPVAGAQAVWLALPGLARAHTVVSGLSAGSDKPGARIRVWWGQGVYALAQGQAGPRELLVSSTVGLGPGTLVAVQGPGGRVAAGRVLRLTPGPGLVLDQDLPAGLGAPGDRVHLLALAGHGPAAEIPLGAGSRELANPRGLVRGPLGSPLLLGVDGLRSCSLEEVLWGFEAPPDRPAIRPGAGGPGVRHPPPGGLNTT